MASPMYITVGPPCAGKTTWIKSQQEAIQDVSIDDQEGVYTPVPIAWFLDREASSSESRKMKLHGMSAYDRIQDQTELCTVLKRLSEPRPSSESEAAVGTPTGTAAEGVLAAVESYMEQHAEIQLPPTIDLFCVEALFRPDPKLKRSAIDRANETLRNAPRSQSIAWGNTNCRCTDYQDALAVAEQYRRPVHFITYSETESTDGQGLLHANNLQDLLQRSIGRLVQTGRYVPKIAVIDMRRRCFEMCGTRTGMELECHLAKLAGYELDASTRLVRGMHDRKRQNDHGRDTNHPHRKGHYPRRGGGDRGRR